MKPLSYDYVQTIIESLLPLPKCTLIQNCVLPALLCVPETNLKTQLQAETNF